MDHDRAEQLPVQGDLHVRRHGPDGRRDVRQGPRPDEGRGGEEVKSRTVTLTRTFAAPRERVFAAWTSAEHLMHWFAPKDFGVHSAEADPRPGGTFRLCMRSPDGRDYWVHGTYRELQPPERLVIVCVAHDEVGAPQLEETIDVTL